ncbi:ganglioside-induced differentiation-associated protein 2 [Sorghum bicolor]|uniref:CRAL-TRIO domain-containing protein n=1 Tax=Sorghum bicolor TaxID=4558 RepID=C5Y1C2_SORBI|nr:ganglioside-induced differentiation-associated protein 2 [Sorghum bicolor]EES05749.1 hypothetical protein SORBI_3004G287000 [Sorghum bicolor]|eukprot:XP_002452773.1 ganglioside-induced differentiation-associated protein 2 [Sorghum bicolor]
MVVTVEKDATGEPALLLLLERSRAITLQGRDRNGRAVVRIVGNYFPARALGGGGRAEEALRSYLRDRVLPEIGGREFVVVYMHSRVDRGHNFPGVGAIRGAYESLPAEAKERLRAVYFVHPALRSRLFFATFGRFLFSSGLYEKLRYMSRLDYVWAHIDKGQLEVPDCVREHDDELERRPLMDYGIEATESRCMYDAASMDSSASLHSLRCVS